MEKFFSGQVKSARVDDDKTKQAEDNAVDEAAPKKLPKGVVLGKDGKPCRSCTSVADWLAMTKKKVPPSPKNATTDIPASTDSSSSSSSSSSSLISQPSDCPPDVETLGRGTWTLLHTISASYPPSATPTQQSEMTQFLTLFSKLYPCWVCADDFREWMGRKGNAPRVEGREGLGRWMCEAHNEVNRKLGKGEFDCGRWEERWRTGWKDGSCD
ncbi:hypothetical protein MMC24_001964 [Lignoscripta atroalba]|nr:hypothetical protein [Lignoscripta atroalba]